MVGKLYNETCKGPGHFALFLWWEPVKHLVRMCPEQKVINNLIYVLEV